MKGAITIIAPQGEVVTEPADAKDDAQLLARLQAIVGGYVERVPYLTRANGRACVAFANEEGKLRGLPYNERATLLWLTDARRRGYTLGGDFLVGTIAVVSGDREFMTWLTRDRD